MPKVFCSIVLKIHHLKKACLHWFEGHFGVALSQAKSLSGEAAWILLGQLAAVVGTLASVRLLTELLDPSAYGELALAMTAASLVGQILFGPLSNGVMRFYAPASEAGEIQGYLRAVRVLLMRCICIIVMISIFAVIFLSLGRRASFIAIVVGASVFALLNGTGSVLSSMQNAARQRRVVALHQGLEPWVRFLIAVTLLTAIGSNSAMAMWSYALASLIIVASQYMFVRKTVLNDRPYDFAGNWQQQLFRYSWPFGAWGIFTWLQLASDRWALEHFSSTAEVGLYVVLYQLGYYPISIATSMALLLLTPIIFKHAGDARDDQRNHSVNRMTWRLAALALVLTVIASMLAYCFQKEIFGLFVSARFSSVMELLPLVVLSGGLFAVGQVLALQRMSLFKTRSMMTAKVATALFGAGLNVFGAYWHGAAGVAFAGLGFSFSYLLWMVLLCHRRGRSTLRANTIV